MYNSFTAPKASAFKRFAREGGELMSGRLCMYGAEVTALTSYRKLTPLNEMKWEKKKEKNHIACFISNFTHLRRDKNEASDNLLLNEILKRKACSSYDGDILKAHAWRHDNS